MVLVLVLVLVVRRIVTLVLVVVVVGVDVVTLPAVLRAEPGLQGSPGPKEGSEPHF